MKVWCVEVSYEDDDPGTYGPYTEAQANRVADRLKEEARLSSSSSGLNFHPHNVRSALASPLYRYDQFLDGEARRAARREVRIEESTR